MKFADRHPKFAKILRVVSTVGMWGSIILLLFVIAVGGYQCSVSRDTGSSYRSIVRASAAADDSVSSQGLPFAKYLASNSALASAEFVGMYAYPNNDNPAIPLPLTFVSAGWGFDPRVLLYYSSSTNTSASMIGDVFTLLNIALTGTVPFPLLSKESPNSSTSRGRLVYFFPSGSVFCNGWAGTIQQSVGGYSGHYTWRYMILTPTTRSAVHMELDYDGVRLWESDSYSAYLQGFSADLRSLFFAVQYPYGAPAYNGTFYDSSLLPSAVFVGFLGTIEYAVNWIPISSLQGDQTVAGGFSTDFVISSPSSINSYTSPLNYCFATWLRGSPDPIALSGYTITHNASAPAFDSAPSVNVVFDPSAPSSLNVPASGRLFAIKNDYPDYPTALSRSYKFNIFTTGSGSGSSITDQVTFDIPTNYSVPHSFLRQMHNYNYFRFLSSYDQAYLTLGIGSALPSVPSPSGSYDPSLLFSTYAPFFDFQLSGMPVYVLIGILLASTVVAIVLRFFAGG